MAKKVKLFFATDVHGSEKCFRKFLNAAPAYAADLVVLGGDVAGKAVQAVEDLGSGRYRTTFRGTPYVMDTVEELERVERLISDLGYYPYRSQPGELDARVADGTIEQLLEDLMVDRLERWMQLADERLRPRDIPAFWMLGNDDPHRLGEVLERAPWGEHAEGRVIDIGDGLRLVSWGFSNRTPWNSFREMPEEDLARHYDELFSQLDDPHRVVFNAHPPPYGTGLDDAPVLDADLTVQQQAGQVKLGPVGSTAVRDAIESYQPVASLHGHVHESAGFRRIGTTMAINPGSDYGTGALNGALMTFSKDKLKSHQLVRG
jgi:Icc-related predicted phosphoesterase